MIDNRLDEIKNLKEGAVEIINAYRQLFIALDNELVKLGDDQHGHRQLAIARTNLEEALMFTIKVIEIQNEKPIH